MKSWLILFSSISGCNDRVVTLLVCHFPSIFVWKATRAGRQAITIWQQQSFCVLIFVFIQYATMFTVNKAYWVYLLGLSQIQKCLRRGEIKRPYVGYPSWKRRVYTIAFDTFLLPARKIKTKWWTRFYEYSALDRRLNIESIRTTDEHLSRTNGRYIEFRWP